MFIDGISHVEVLGTYMYCIYRCMYKKLYVYMYMYMYAYMYAYCTCLHTCTCTCTYSTMGMIIMHVSLCPLCIQYMYIYFGVCILLTLPYLNSCDNVSIPMYSSGGTCICMYIHVHVHVL